MYKESAVDYFDRHKSSNECHITSDGRVFHTKGSADGFANGLKDNTVESYTRSGMQLAEINVVDAKEETGDNPPAPDKVYTDEDLKSFNFDKPDYIVAKKLVKDLGLESKSQKLADLVEVILAAKNKVETQE